MTTLKVNMVTTQDYYRQKLNLMYEIQTEEVYKDLTTIRKSLTLVIIQLNQIIMTI